MQGFRGGGFGIQGLGFEVGGYTTGGALNLWLKV
jgi:hypothetical protein